MTRPQPGPDPSGGAARPRPAPETERLQAARLLAGRLERLSADSHWARQASGLRGALLRCLEDLEAGVPSDLRQIQRLEDLLQRGQTILVKAARLIRTPDTQYD